MTRRIILRRAAQAEYDAAGDWYEQQRPGLGAAFTAAVQQVFDRIAANPRMHTDCLAEPRLIRIGNRL